MGSGLAGCDGVGIGVGCVEELDGQRRGLLGPGCISQLAEELGDPINQRPSMLLFVRRLTEDVAFRELFIVFNV